MKGKVLIKPIAAGVAVLLAAQVMLLPGPVFASEIERRVPDIESSGQNRRIPDSDRQEPGTQEQYKQDQAPEENSTNTNEEKHYNTAYQLTEDDIFQMNNGDAAMLFLFLRFFYASVPMHACAAFMTAYLPCSYVSPPWKKTV